LLDEKGGHADQTKPSSRETLDSENTATEAITLLLPVCKNNKNPELNTIAPQTVKEKIVLSSSLIRCHS